MSFRELRSFTETMRLLGYPNLISMDSFRGPNVELVADCLYWLLKRYEPSTEVVYEIEREADRVFFFKQVCEAVLAKTRIKLNIKKLYQADGHAVQEMFKLAHLLKQAMHATNNDEPDFAALQQMAAQKNVHESKAIQQLCSDITVDGSSLFFLMGEEINMRRERQHVLSRATEVGEFERRLRELLTSVTNQAEQLCKSVTQLKADESSLEQKIENKKTQIERLQRRFNSLASVRPAYIEEYNLHEAELHAQFVKYLEQYRNLEYLEHQLATFRAKEDALLKEQQTALSVIRERLRKEELKVFQNGKQNFGFDNGADDDENSSSYSNEPKASHIRVRNAAQEGSSVSDTSSNDKSTSLQVDNLTTGVPPRSQNVINRSGSLGVKQKQQHGTNVSMASSDDDDHDDSDLEPASSQRKRPDHVWSSKRLAAQSNTPAAKYNQEDSTSMSGNSDEESGEVTITDDDDDTTMNDDDSDASSSQESDI